MTKAIVIRAPGGPEAMRFEEVDVGAPGPGDIRVAQTAVGVNFIDTYHRSGLYPVVGNVPALGPKTFIPGMEAAGRVVAVGKDVADLKIGDRIAYPNGPLGAYAAERVMPANKVVRLPPGISDQQAAGMMLRGLTVWYLLFEIRPVRAGETVLLHAAAGGIGLIFCQWARHLGVTVIGTVGSPEKAKLARDAGCTHTILYGEEDWVARVRQLTDGKGVPVVFDGVGKTTFLKSLDCLAPRGLMVTFGNASGAAPAFEPTLLAAKGSLMVTRPRLHDFIATHADMVRGSEKLFEVVNSGAAEIDIGQTFALSDAAEAHRALESRQTTGSTILVP